MANLFEVTADASTASVRIVVNVDGASYLKVTRLVGALREPVRVMNPWSSPAASGVRDMECPLETPVSYEVTGYDGSDQVVATLTAGPVTVAATTGDWLRPITRPLEGMRIWVESYPQQDRAGRVATFDVLGSADRVALTSVRGLPKGVLTVVTMTDSERAQFLNLLTSGEPLVFLTPESHGVGRQYLVVFDVSETRIVNYALEESRRWSLQVEEIGYPAGQTAQWTFQTWDDLPPMDWDTLEATYQTWLSVPETSPAAPPSPGGRKAKTTPALFGV